MGISRASKVRIFRRCCQSAARLREKFRQPVLVESFLPGREFTVGIIGTGSAARAIGVLEILLRPDAEPDAYSFTNKRDYETLVRYRLADDVSAGQVADLALRVWRRLNCRDAGRVDIRLDESRRPSFLEVNPLAGLHPRHSDLVILCRMVGIEFEQLLQMIVESAERRRNPGARM
jgi:D-alanine-D-alanine ligase